ncbi:MAG: peptidoglycan DD-metalloendopeptidase family protein, partial [Elstera sp.]
DLLQTDVTVMRTRIVSTDDERRRAAAARASIDRNIARLEGELSSAQNRAIELEKILVQKQQVVDQAQTVRRQAVAERDSAVEKAAQVEAKMAALAQQQQQALAKLQERTQGTLQRVEAVFTAAGVDPKRLSPIINGRDGKGARGGPFVPWSDQVKELAPEVRGKTDQLGTSIERLDVLRPLLNSLPLSVPVRNDYAVMSGFGYRKDPFNGRAALHEGLDLQAAHRTPIRPGAPGRVVFAGWHPQYGRLVEVDHGYSIRTRYAHMDELSVTDGQEVDRGTVLGLMGRSGRASGVHLHYEVVVNGRPLDPANFMRAASYVFKVK